MSSGPPRFFVDRSLGRRMFPDALRAAGIELSTLAEVYGVPADEEVSDVDWLGRAGAEGWAVLMKDDRIRYRPAERTALVRAGVIAFCVASGNMRAADMAEMVISQIDAIRRICSRPGPSLTIVSRGGLRDVALSTVPRG